MSQGNANQELSQRAISEVVEVIRTWLLTICHDLCIAPPKVQIRKPIHESTYNFCPIGGYDRQTNTITLFVVGERMTEQYVLALAHELRHAFQHHNGIASTERDAENYEREFSERFKNGPEAGRYHGPIAGLSVIVRCATCGEKVDASEGTTCRRCRGRSRTSPYSRSHWDHAATSMGDGHMRCNGCGKLIERCKGGLCYECLNQHSGCAPFYGPFDPGNRTTGPAPSRRGTAAATAASKPSLVVRLRAAYEQRQQDRMRREADERLSYWMRNVDNHPSNGQAGWWAIEEAYYVFAASAGEAIIKVGNPRMSHLPSIRFLGTDLPADVKRRAEKA